MVDGLAKKFSIMANFGVLANLTIINITSTPVNISLLLHVASTYINNIYIFLLIFIYMLFLIKFFVVVFVEFINIFHITKLIAYNI